jgi:hypothetical protein
METVKKYLILFFKLCGAGFVPAWDFFRKPLRIKLRNNYGPKGRQGIMFSKSLPTRYRVSDKDFTDVQLCYV